MFDFKSCLICLKKTQIVNLDLQLGSIVSDRSAFFGSSQSPKTRSGEATEKYSECNRSFQRTIWGRSSKADAPWALKVWRLM